MIIAAPGSLSDGFTIRVFPVAAAMGIVQRGIILKGREFHADQLRVRNSRREVEWRDATNSWDCQQIAMAMYREERTWRIHLGAVDEWTYPCPSRLTCCVSS